MGGVEARMASPELQSINERGDELDLNTREAKRENTYNNSSVFFSFGRGVDGLCAWRL